MERLRNLFGPRLALMIAGFSLPSLKREEGQTLVEYALILTFIAILVIVALTFVQTKITALFSKIGNSL